MATEISSSTPNAGRPCPGLRVVDESDDYTSAVAGITVEGFRVGKGIGPNVVLGAPGRHLTVTSSHLGFPMAAGASVPPDRVIAACIHRNPAESKWCGTTLREGSVIVYAPGAEHVAINQPGLHFTFAVTGSERLMAVAEELGLPADAYPTPGLHEIPPSPSADGLAAALQRLTTAALDGTPVEGCEESVLVSFAEILSGDTPSGAACGARGLDSRQIVVEAIGYAEATGRVPMIAELCGATHVSERRLRSAFGQEFDCSPTQYFRSWALGRAHQMLRDSVPGQRSVSEIACDLGLNHLGRFACSYRTVYGETPSETLRSA